MLSTAIWFLVIGAVFYFMMKKGCCGAHAAGHGGSGHGCGASHEGTSGGDQGWTVEDPVCGAKGQLDASRPAVERDGKMYYYCSDRCRDLFVQDPARYVASPYVSGGGNRG